MLDPLRTAVPIIQTSYVLLVYFQTDLQDFAVETVHFRVTYLGRALRYMMELQMVVVGARRGCRRGVLARMARRRLEMSRLVHYFGCLL